MVMPLNYVKQYLEVSNVQGKSCKNIKKKAVQDGFWCISASKPDANAFQWYVGDLVDQTYL